MPRSIKELNKPTTHETSPYAFYQSADNKYSIVYKEHQGKRHLVVPVVMMKTGVHCGSHGPILHKIEELGKIVEAWNGIPITIEHPTQDGTPISANSPTIIDEKTVGRVYNAFVDGDKLKAECWLDEEKLISVSCEAYEYIKKQWPLDVSVGVFTEDEAEEGMWNGEEYSAVAYNHRPDHLALLPGSVGACSWADGCGIRVNEEGRQNDVNLQEAISQLFQAGFSAYKSGVSHEMVRDQLYSAISGKAGKDGWASLEQVFDDFFVYQVVTFSPDGPSKEALYKQEYSLTKEGSVELNGNPSLVRRKVDYVAMGITRKKGGNAEMDKKAKVNMLIQSKQTPFVEANRDFLEGLEESQLDELQAKFQEPTPAPAVHSEPTPSPIDHIQALRESIKSEEDFLRILPEGPVKESIRSGVRLNNARKMELVEKITAHSKEFTVEELQAKGVDELGKIASLIPAAPAAPGDYSPLAAHGSRPAAKVEDVLPPCGVELE